MADPVELPNRGKTVVGDEVFLYVEAEEAFQPAVDVFFGAAFEKLDAKKDNLLLFEESLIAEPTTLRDPAKSPGKKASRIKWKANLKDFKEFEHNTVELTFSVQGKGESGATITAKSIDTLHIEAIKITKEPKLTRIMLHEFAKIENGKPVLDTAPLQNFIDSLSVPQKKLLIRQAQEKPEGRLVVFITLYPNKGLLMDADFCDPGSTRVHPNACFTVFHCEDLGKRGVTLVCHTEHFLLNLVNGPTNSFIHTNQGKKKPNEWMNKKNPNPVQLKIASQVPGLENDGVIWSCIYTPKGNNIMPGNTMHGMINTVGCWMLFKNYNWPKDKEADFEKVYRLFRKEGKKAKKSIFKALADLGYDVVSPPPPDKGTSVSKFLNYDRNYAYLWFFHDLVGIKYFSKQVYFISGVNENVAHPLIFSNSFELKKADDFDAMMDDIDFEKSKGKTWANKGKFLYHDLKYRHREDTRNKVSAFKPDDSLWQDNVLGFRTSSKFIPNAKRYKSLTTGEVGGCAWADLYLFREDDLDVEKLKSNFLDK